MLLGLFECAAFVESMDDALKDFGCGTELTVEASGQRIVVGFCGAFPPDNSCKAVRKGATSRIKLPDGASVKVEDYISRYQRNGNEILFIGSCRGKSMRYDLRTRKLSPAAEP